MKNLLASVLICFAVPFVFAQSSNKSAASHPNFSGDWIFNEFESKAPTGLSREAFLSNAEVITRIVHNDPEFRIITINRTTRAIESQFVYYTDGRDGTISTRLWPEKTKTKWEGDELVTKGSHRAAETTPMGTRLPDDKILVGHATDVGGEKKTEWSLSPDGNQLTEAIKITTRLRVRSLKIDRIDEHKSEIIKVYDRSNAVN